MRNENHMKPFHHNTSAQEASSQPPIASWLLALQHLHQSLAPHFARPEVHQHALLFLHAVLSDIPRKNGWHIAEQVRLERPDAMQRLLSQAVWDHDAVRDALRTQVFHTLHPSASTPADPLAPFPVLVVDESGFPKRGTHSAGVAPQYCGVHGRVENCQVGVFLSYVTAHGHALMDRELYLPEQWCTDEPRRRAAHIPASVRFATKPELAQRMIERVQAAALPISWVVADTVYGHSSELRRFLQQQHTAYVLAVPSNEVVAVHTPRGPLLADVSGILQQADSQAHWQRLSQSLGSKGERLFDWAIFPLLPQDQREPQQFLLFRRCLDDPSIVASFLVFTPTPTPLSTIVQAIGARWRIEEDLHACKQLGLDHYEVRSYHGWYRHLTLVLLAYAFLVGRSVQDTAARAASPPPATESALIALTPAEVQHLLAHLLVPAPSSLPFISHWSHFRRRHQYWAGYSHRRRRQKAAGAC